MLSSEDWFEAGKETASAQRRSHQVHLSKATQMIVHMYKNNSWTLENCDCLGELIKPACDIVPKLFSTNFHKFSKIT